MEEASNVTFGSALIELFANILIFVLKGNELEFWNRHKHNMCNELMLRFPKNTPTAHIENEVLKELDIYIARQGISLTEKFGLPQPNYGIHFQRQSLLIMDQTQHDMEELQEKVFDAEVQMNDEQRLIVETVTESVRQKSGQMFAIDASGGTGKTYVLRTIIHKLRLENKVILATAASGIAATLLPKGTTFHSRTKCPLILFDDSVCCICEKDENAELIRMTDAMIVDEVSMMDRRALEAADRTFRWLRKTEKPFGGITMIFSGDWRQILTVVIHGTRMDVVSRSLKSSYIWKNVHIFRLQENMRVKNSIGQEKDLKEQFANYLLDLGEGKIPNVPEEGEFAIEINETLALENDTIADITNWVYDDMNNHFQNHEWLRERVILSSTNAEIDMVNEYMTRRFPGKAHVCNSVDTAETEGKYTVSIEILNSLCPSGMPPHQMTLKIGMLIMLLRNIDQINGHCNGSRYVIEDIRKHLLIVKSVTGTKIGNTLLIPRFNLCPTEDTFPFKMTRRQFPVRPCFAMTVNKSQGQTLERVGILCMRDFFSHGQLYVAMSRVGSSECLRILSLDESTKEKRRFINNVVYKEVFQN